MAVANKVHKQGLQHHALCHITMHPYCKPNLQTESTVATYVAAVVHIFKAKYCTFSKVAELEEEQGEPIQ